MRLLLPARCTLYFFVVVCNIRHLLGHCIRYIHVMTPASGIIESPFFPTPYQAGISCLFNISTVPSNVVQISFLSFDLAEKNSNSGQCLDAYVLVIVVDRQGREHVGDRLCGTDLPLNIKTMQPVVHVQFVTTAHGGQHRGFKIQYDIISEAAIREPPSYVPNEEKEFAAECGGTTLPGQLTGEITSPGFPLIYPRNVTCNWLIRVEPWQRIYIRLVYLHLSASIAECERASLIILDGYKHDGGWNRKDSAPDSSEARFCGSQLYYTEEGMKSYMSTANRLLIRLTTRDHPPSSTIDQRVGFKIIWTAIEGLLGESTSSSSALPSFETLQQSDYICDQFVCQGGLCIEQGHGVCATRSQLCIHSSLVCNGVQNCVEGDYSDEQHCYSREIIMAACGVFFGLVLIVFVIVCCDQWRKHRRLQVMIRERRAAQNGKGLRPHQIRGMSPRPPR